MRHIILAVILGCFTLSAPAESQAFHAAVSRLTVQDATAPIDTVVFYPTEAPECPGAPGRSP